MEKVSGEAGVRALVVAGTAFALAVVGALAPCAIARAEGAANRPGIDEPGLVGTWRLVRFEDTSRAGKVSYPHGEHPLGYFVYDTTGHLSVQIMHNPPISTLPRSAPTEAEARKAANDAYAAYFGTYRVDKANHVLHHVVEGATNPDYLVNRDQVRPYRLEGDTLFIEMTDQKTGVHDYRELHRVK